MEITREGEVAGNAHETAATAALVDRLHFRMLRAHDAGPYGHALAARWRSRGDDDRRGRPRHIGLRSILEFRPTSVALFRFTRILPAAVGTRFESWSMQR